MLGATHPLQLVPDALHVPTLQTEVSVDVQQVQFVVTLGDYSLKEGVCRDIVCPRAMASSGEVEPKRVSRLVDRGERGVASGGVWGIPCLTSDIIVMSFLRI